MENLINKTILDTKEYSILSIGLARSYESDKILLGGMIYNKKTKDYLMAYEPLKSKVKYNVLERLGRKLLDKYKKEI